MGFEGYALTAFLRAEARAAAAAAGGVGVAEDEPSTHHLILEVLRW